MALLKTLFGLDLPTSGKVVGKATDPAREIDYSGGNPNSIVGVKSINREPLFWLEIKDGKKKARWVQVPKKTYDSAQIGEFWSAAAETARAAAKRPRL